jgi:3-hydroxyacyl-[acyl-carrier-protein] dehydratase
MLKNNFFRLAKPLAGGDGLLNATIALDREHPIFKGHFPGMPVVPGVCMMAIIKELLEEKFERLFVLQQAANIKFLSLINPLVNDEVEVEIRYLQQDNSLVAEGTILAGEQTFFKVTRAVYK